MQLFKSYQWFDSNDFAYSMNFLVGRPRCSLQFYDQLWEKGNIYCENLYVARVQMKILVGWNDASTAPEKLSYPGFISMHYLLQDAIYDRKATFYSVKKIGVCFEKGASRKRTNISFAQTTCNPCTVRQSQYNVVILLSRQLSLENSHRNDHVAPLETCLKMNMLMLCENIKIRNIAVSSIYDSQQVSRI